MDEKKNSLIPLKDVISSLLGDTALPFNPDDARIWKYLPDSLAPEGQRRFP